MKIGFSLPLDYVLDVDTDAGKSDFFQWVGEPLTFLKELKQHGVQSVELQGIGPELSDAAVFLAMRRINATGLHFTFHGRLPSEGRAETVSADLALPLPPAGVAAFLNALDNSPVMVVHAYDMPGARYEELVTASIKGLRVLLKNLKRHALPIRVALEINRYHGVNTPGVTYDGLLEIGAHFAPDELGFCWDMGHTQSSFLQQKLPAAPPPEFVARVIHTHIHDLSSEGDTHRALCESCPHLEAGIHSLEACGYTGIYNLELYPSRWAPEENVKDAILRSVARLQTILGF